MYLNNLQKFYTVILLILTLNSVLGLKWSDCGPEDAKITFHKFDLIPHPIVFGSKANLITYIKVVDSIKEGYSDLSIQRVFSAFGFEVPISLPCVDGYGSCVSDLKFTLFDSDMVCGLMKSANRTCGTPLEKGPIQTDNYEFDVPPLNGIFSLFATGLYRIKWNWLDLNKKSIGCINADIDLSS